MSADTAMQAESTADPLVTRFATPRWYLETITAQRRALEGAPQFRLPLLMCIGDADPVADPIGGEEGGYVTRGDAEHLGDDPRVVAWPGPVEEGLPVLAQREQRLGGAGSDRQEEYRNGEEPDAPRA